MANKKHNRKAEESQLEKSMEKIQAKLKNREKEYSQFNRFYPVLLNSGENSHMAKEYYQLLRKCACSVGDETMGDALCLLELRYPQLKKYY